MEYRELIIYGLHTGVIQVILNSIEFEMHKQTEMFVIFDSQKRPTQGFCIYICGLLQPAGEVSHYDRFWQPLIQTQLVAESLLTPDWLFLYTY